MRWDPPSGVTEEEWAEHIHEGAEPIRKYLEKSIFAAVDLMLMPSQETYYDVWAISVQNSFDFFKAYNELPSDYSEEHAEYMLAYLMEHALARLWKIILEKDDGYRWENREWLNEVIGAALAGSRDDEKTKVAEYLDQLKKINLYEIWMKRGR